MPRSRTYPLAAPTPLAAAAETTRAWLPRLGGPHECPAVGTPAMTARERPPRRLPRRSTPPRYRRKDSGAEPLAAAAYPSAGAGHSTHEQGTGRAARVSPDTRLHHLRLLTEHGFLEPPPSAPRGAERTGSPTARPARSGSSRTGTPPPAATWAARSSRRPTRSFPRSSPATFIQVERSDRAAGA